MDSRDTPESSTGGVGVRVLLPDGGQMEQPEEEGESEDAEETSEEQTDAEGEETDAESEESEESESAEGDEQEAEGEDDEADEKQAEGDQEDEAAEDEEAEDEEEAEAGEGDEDESEEEAEAEGEGQGEEDEEESEREKAVSDEGARLLHLNIDGLFLDLLGLEVDLDTVTLDLTAVEGESKLLGNLLSAVSGLLGGDPLSSLLPDMPDNPLGGLLGGGEGDEEGEGDESEGSGLLPDVHPLQRAKELAGSMADAIRSAIDDAGSSIISALPLEELLAQFLQEVVNQLLDTSDDGDEADAEEAAASA